VIFWRFLELEFFDDLFFCFNLLIVFSPIVCRHEIRSTGRGFAISFAINIVRVHGNPEELIVVDGHHRLQAMKEILQEEKDSGNIRAEQEYGSVPCIEVIITSFLFFFCIFW
jgi:hypothetical protein